ncbi:hypothetical protein QR680_016029 [Steinernema hermaphroditum]|uniref:Hexosyltransferase n=1 Tax=Steinernema hermaphroditum TaxID=289476 RepID=A0AA39H9S8_9BILA|nr:hypothetical protein QR680_016029 [Steinernema hermaphroditum]
MFKAVPSFLKSPAAKVAYVFLFIELVIFGLWIKDNAKANVTGYSVVTVNATFANYFLEYKIGEQFDSKRCDGKQLFVFVITAVKLFDQRDLIRKTWANKKHLQDAFIVFIVGQPKSRLHEELLLKEKELYSDVVVTNIPDSYNFTAFKVHAGYYIHNTYCAHVPFILRADDDIVTLPDRFVHFIKTGYFGNEDKAIFGILLRNTQPVRDPNHKWYIPMDYYNQSTFPTYVNGPAYLMTGKSVEAILEKTKETTFFWIEDLIETLELFKFHCNKRDANGVAAFNSWDHVGYCMREVGSCDKAGIPYVTLISHAPAFQRPDIELAYSDLVKVRCNESSAK